MIGSASRKTVLWSTVPLHNLPAAQLANEQMHDFMIVNARDVLVKKTLQTIMGRGNHG